LRWHKLHVTELEYKGQNRSIMGFGKNYQAKRSESCWMSGIICKGQGYHISYQGWKEENGLRLENFIRKEVFREREKKKNFSIRSKRTKEATNTQRKSIS